MGLNLEPGEDTTFLKLLLFFLAFVAPAFAVISAIVTGIAALVAFIFGG
jgi:hypothetical protein